MKKRNTKKALLGSIVSLILCCSMLLGSTFAWFTDSVSSANNIIAAGNLDIELYHADNGTNNVNEKVEYDTVLFDDVDSALWEPGAMAWERFTVTNEGKLALKYRFALNARNATEVDGVSFASVLKVALIDDESFVYTRENVSNIPADKWKNIDSLEPITSSDAFLAGDIDTFGIVIWWQPSAIDNMFNMNNGKTGKVSIDVGVVLNATQATFEGDSFDETYDTDSTLPSTGTATAPDNFAEPIVVEAGDGSVTIPTNAESGIYNLEISNVHKKTDGNQMTIFMDIDLTKDGAKIVEKNGVVYTVDYFVGVDGNILEVTHKGNTTDKYSYNPTTGIISIYVTSFCPFTVTLIPSVIYDEDSAIPMASVNFKTEEAIEDKINDDGAVEESFNIGAEKSDIVAEVPAGVTFASGVTKAELSVNTIKEEESNANVVLEEGEVAVSLDVHIEGIAEDNTVPMKVTLKGLLQKGMDAHNFKLYHVENGETVAMTFVSLAELDAHNEFYYDAITGDVILSLASFSEVMAITEEVVHWDGQSAESFAAYQDASYGDGSKEKPYLIATAGQLAYFRDLVDGKKTAEGIDPTFKGKYVQLANDIILNHHDEQNNLFDPIGWGYANKAYNRDGVDGKVFMGTFDGNNHAIHGLYQNGWDLEEAAKNATYNLNYEEDYTYTNCGFGLFASVQDATIKNLTMKHANVKVECVEAGIVVGLAQGDCTFENVYIYHGNIANYQRPAGGVVGEVSPKYVDGAPVNSEHRFINVHVGSSTTVGSLWGDFDAPCGGVIGAYWDDASKTNVYMESVDVSCVLDVYNDVTSAYQWYAYRRAGMLIGNTDRSTTVDGRTVAYAPYLTCTNCVIIYDDWRNYTYCEFTNEANPGKAYPWVRVEPGKNNPSYSNPRYGHPTDAAGEIVVDDVHTHLIGDECFELIPFDQLYGGGQGVYGQNKHEGVTEGKYTITFIGADGDMVDVIYVVDNESDFKLEGKLPDTRQNGELPLKWEDANGVVYASRNDNEWTYYYGEQNKNTAGNLVDIVLYPEWPEEFNIYFVDHNGKTLHYQKFDEGQTPTLDAAAIEEARMSVQKEIDHTAKVIQVKWKYNGELITTFDSEGNATTDFTRINFNGANDDITISMELTLSNLSITLKPIYDTNTNVLIEYHVVDVNATETNKNINIPSHVGHVPVTRIEEGTFDGFNNLTAVKIPVTVTTLGSGMFPGDTKLIFGDGRQQVTIYYTGTPDQWKALTEKADCEGWDDTLGDGSRVFFLDADGDVIPGSGYYELYKNGTNDYVWLYHKHAYTMDAMKNCEEQEDEKHYEYYPGLWGIGATWDESKFTDYDGEGRPDREYWLKDGQPII